MSETASTKTRGTYVAAVFAQQVRLHTVSLAPEICAQSSLDAGRGLVTSSQGLFALSLLPSSRTTSTLVTMLGGSLW